MRIPGVEPVSKEAFFENVMLDHDDEAVSIEANPESWRPVVEGVRAFADGFAAIQKALSDARGRDGRKANTSELFLVERMIGAALKERFPHEMFQLEAKRETAERAFCELMKGTIEETDANDKEKRYERWATELCAKRRLGYASLLARATAAGEGGLVIDDPSQLTEDERLVFEHPNGFHGFSAFTWPQLGRTAMFIVHQSHGAMYAEELPISYGMKGERETLSERRRERESTMWNLPPEVRVHERFKQREAYDGLMARLAAGEEIIYRDREAIPPHELAAFLGDDYSRRDFFLELIGNGAFVKLWLRKDDGTMMAISHNFNGKIQDMYAIPRP